LRPISDVVKGCEEEWGVRTHAASASAAAMLSKVGRRWALHKASIPLVLHSDVTCANSRPPSSLLHPAYMHPTKTTGKLPRSLAPCLHDVQVGVVCCVLRLLMAGLCQIAAHHLPGTRAGPVAGTCTRAGPGAGACTRAGPAEPMLPILHRHQDDVCPGLWPHVVAAGLGVHS
jgi:hypothetical protein